MQPRDGCLATGAHPGHGPGHLWVPRLQQLVSRDVPRRQDDHDGHGEPCSKIAKKPTGPARAVLRESVLPQACDAGGAGGSPAQGPGVRVRLPLCAGRRAQAVKGVAQGPESRVAHSAAPLTVNLNVNRSAGGLTSSARLERRGAFMIIRNNQIQTTQVGAREY